MVIVSLHTRDRQSENGWMWPCKKRQRQTKTPHCHECSYSSKLICMWTISQQNENWMKNVAFEWQSSDFCSHVAIASVRMNVFMYLSLFYFLFYSISCPCINCHTVSCRVSSSATDQMKSKNYGFTIFNLFWTGSKKEVRSVYFCENGKLLFSSRKSSNSWLSTGWFTMAIALELCDRINVYGMVPPAFCR